MAFSPGYNYERYATATPSPRPYHASAAAAYGASQERSQTRAHFRTTSSGDYYSTSYMASPRYTSSGQYATANVSSRTRKFCFSGEPSGRRRRKSESQHDHPRSFTYHAESYGESDEDEFIQIDGVTYVIPARSRQKHFATREPCFARYTYAAGYGTDRGAQGGGGVQASFGPTPSPRHPSSRRSSTSAPQGFGSGIPRSKTVMPERQQSHASSKKTQAAPPRREASAEDAKKFRIPTGYSLKNWDPTEEPIMLLGSVFDSNSLGKWIYDWTVFHHGPATPISDMAGELWLLLINLAGKIKKSEEVMPRIRTEEKKDMVEDFIESGDRLTDKLRKLLKTCEAPMLKSSSPSSSSRSALGKNAGVEFVRTLFGRDRELEKTERFMQSVRLWNLRFDANCTDVLENPTR